METEKTLKITMTDETVTMPREIWESFRSVFDSQGKALEFLIEQLKEKRD